ncbi:MAG: NUDIX hydrolase [Methylococcaceae bacterium]|nr:MAG: NUDIX hydrolase [Methylococcaceae bacterium]
MKYCSICGASIRYEIPEGDNRKRHICISCGFIHYQNPKIIAGCIPAWEESILLCRRAIEPRLGLWTVPAGFMEQGETLSEAASRETWEEATAEVELDGVHTIITIPHISHVQVLFRAHLKEPKFSPGYESLETKLFNETEIPWNELAFETVHRALHLYFTDKHQGNFKTHIEDYIKPTA